MTFGIGRREMDETGRVVANIQRGGSTATQLVVNLSSSDTSKAVAPFSVTIPAGQGRVVFYLDAVDNSLRGDPYTTVSFTATAPGFTPATNEVDIIDDDVATLNLSIAAAEFSENGGTTSLRWTTVSWTTLRPWR